jgi:hypothetical protein
MQGGIELLLPTSVLVDQKKSLINRGTLQRRNMEDLKAKITLAVGIILADADLESVTNKMVRNKVSYWLHQGTGPIPWMEVGRGVEEALSTHMVSRGAMIHHALLLSTCCYSTVFFPCTLLQIPHLMQLALSRDVGINLWHTCAMKDQQIQSDLCIHT